MIVFKYILKELIPQFFLSLIMICSVIVVSQLIRISEEIIKFGVTIENIFMPFLFMMMPFVSLAIPMAFIFAVMVTFSRISADGELVGLLSFGYSLKQMLLPVILFATVVCAFGVYSAVNFESLGRRGYRQFFHRKMQTEIDNIFKYKLKSGVFVKDFIGFTLYAGEVSSDRKQLKNVMISPNKKQNSNFVVIAPTGSVQGSIASGEFFLNLQNGRTVSTKKKSSELKVIKFETMKMSLLQIFKDQILGNVNVADDYLSYTPSRLSTYIASLRNDKNRDQQTYLRARFLFHQRIGLSFIIFAFALFGVVYGVSDQRLAKNRGYILVIVTIVITYVLISLSKWLSESGYIAPVIAVWGVNVLFLSISGFLVHQKNRLPLSENLLSLHNVPLGFLKIKRGGKLDEG